jgi:hypothetical protein
MHASLSAPTADTRGWAVLCLSIQQRNKAVADDLLRGKAPITGKAQKQLQMMSTHKQSRPAYCKVEGELRFALKDLNSHSAAKVPSPPSVERTMAVSVKKLDTFSKRSRKKMYHFNQAT